MRFNSVIRLFKVEVVQDELLNSIKRESQPRKVYANKFSVSRAEFDSAGNQGIKPDLAYQLNSIDYQGELKALVDDVKYDVYRTSENGDKTTIYLTRRLSNGKNN